MKELFNNLLFIFQRLNWVSFLDIILVAIVFFVLLLFLRNTQAMVLLRGILFLVILFSILTSLGDLFAFSWLIEKSLPALLLSIPVIFAPEIRRALERFGRASKILPTRMDSNKQNDVIGSVVHAAERLSNRKHGALIILQRFDSLEEYVSTGVRMDSIVTPELLLQIFYPNTPLHDGAVIISGDKISSAGSVMPLSASGVLSFSSERKMGLRHRAALGSSEVSDAVVVVVSEETGAISIATNARMIHRLEASRLESVIRAIYVSQENKSALDRIASWFSFFKKKEKFEEINEDL